MNEQDIKMHLAAGKYYGKATTCLGKHDKGKYKHTTEEAARKAAGYLNETNKARNKLHTVEAYPCYWCSERFPDQIDDFVHLYWHIGRAMNQNERKIFSDRAADILSMEEVVLSVSGPVFGEQLGEATLRVHNRKVCEGQFCSIHNPSQGPMANFPMNWRGDRRIMERICPCGISHPDKDDADYRKSRDGDNYDTGVHGCCGFCCNPYDIEGQEASAVAYGYAVTKNGKVWSFWKTGGPHRGNKPFVDWFSVPKELKLKDNGKGYKNVCLVVNGENKYLYVHRLVWSAWNGRIPSKLEVRHKDGIRDHNWLFNLELGTSIENAADKERHGTKITGESHKNSKLTSDIVIEARKLWKNGTTLDSIKTRMSLSVNRATIHEAVTGLTWKQLNDVESPYKPGRWAG